MFRLLLSIAFFNYIIRSFFLFRRKCSRRERNVNWCAHNNMINLCTNIFCFILFLFYVISACILSLLVTNSKRNHFKNDGITKKCDISFNFNKSNDVLCSSSHLLHFLFLFSLDWFMELRERSMFLTWKRYLLLNVLLRRMR